MPVEKLRRFLDSHDVRYVTIRHSPAFTAQEVAAAAHIPGEQLAKTVMVELDGEMAMAVLPASCRIDLDLLRDVTGANDVQLVAENDFKDRFPGCEPGAMPPFGNLFGMDVYVAEALAEDEEIAFNAGTHQDSIHMKYADFARLANPTIAQLALSRAA